MSNFTKRPNVKFSKVFCESYNLKVTIIAKLQIKRLNVFLIFFGNDFDIFQKIYFVQKCASLEPDFALSCTFAQIILFSPQKHFENKKIPILGI